MSASFLSAMNTRADDVELTEDDLKCIEEFKNTTVEGFCKGCDQHSDDLIHNDEAGWICSTCNDVLEG